MKAIVVIPEEKTCARCKLLLPVTLFGRNKQQSDGLHCYCRTCASEKTRLRMQSEEAKARKALAEKRRTESTEAKARQRAYRKEYFNRGESKQKRAEYIRQYNKRPEVILKAKEKRSSPKTRDYFKRYRATESNRKKQRDYERDRNKTCPLYSTKKRLRVRLAASIRKAGGIKASTESILGCNYSELVTYLESKFLPGMSWGNRKDWHIDHITPLASANTIQGIERLFHYTNLQPLWAIDNLKKGSKTCAQ